MVNTKAKKILAAVLLVAVMTVLAAGAASARGWGGHHGSMGRGEGWGPCGRGAYFDGPRGGGRGGYGYGHGGRYYGADVPEVPQEIRDKMAKAQEIAIDLRNELSKNPINREKALELHKQHSDIMQEISDWRFQQRFDTYNSR